MSAQIEPGMKVECIYRYPDRMRAEYPELTFPTLGAVYTVRQVIPAYDGLRLREIVNPPILARAANGQAIVDEPVFEFDCFRPIDRTEDDVEQFRELVRKARRGEFVDDMVTA